MAEACRHELTVGTCADCMPRPPRAPREAAGFGPWITARFDSECDGCGNDIFEGDQIRSDGAGGWLRECCGGEGDG